MDAEPYLAQGRSQIVVAAIFEWVLLPHDWPWLWLSLEIDGRFVAEMNTATPVVATRIDPGTYELVLKSAVGRANGRTLCSTTVDVHDRSAAYVAVYTAKQLARAQVVKATLSADDFAGLRRSWFRRRPMLPSRLARRIPCE
jgi:hypothetical protein